MPGVPICGGAYSHALKSVAVGPDGALYFSIGSTGNITADDRTANPPRATIMRIPPGGGPAAPFATGVRNGTGLAIGPDGAVWTAVNNRDNVANPQTREVTPDYVNDHPPEALARLTPGRELGWPYCNPDGGPANLPFIRDVQTNADGSKLDCAKLPPVEQSLGAHAAPLGHELHRERAARSVLQQARWSACTGRGTVNPRAHPRSRSFLGRTAISATSRPSSAASRPRTARGGAARSPR